MSRSIFERYQVVHLFTAIFSLLFISCNTMYIPTMQNVPMLEEKGDMQAAISSKNFQFTYAPIKSWAIFANYKRKSSQLLPLNDDKAWGWLAGTSTFEGGIGTFKKSEKSGVDFFMGYGEGYSSISYEVPHLSAGQNGIMRGGWSHFQKFFFQPDVYFGQGSVQANIGFRVSFLNFYDFMDLSGATINTHPVFVEPSFTLRKKIDQMSLRFQMQYSSKGANLSYSLPTSSKYIPYGNTFLVFMAVEIYFDKLFPGLKRWKNK